MPLGQNRKNISHGVLASSSSSNHLSKEDVQKFYFSTSVGREFYERPVAAEDRGENMLHIQNAGKTYGKYLPYRTSKAPLLDRDATRYTKEYKENPAPVSVQYEMNKRLAESYGPKPFRSSPPVRVESFQTKYTDEYGPEKQLTTSQMRQAKPALLEKVTDGGLELMLGGGGHAKTTVLKSHLQSTHIGHFKPPFDVRGEAADPSKGHIELQGYHSGDFQRTAYHNDFNSRKCNQDATKRRNQQVGSAFRMSIQRSSSAADMRRTF